MCHQQSAELAITSSQEFVLIAVLCIETMKSQIKAIISSGYFSFSKQPHTVTAMHVRAMVSLSLLLTFVGLVETRMFIIELNW